MPKIYDNFIMEGLRGTLGNKLVFRVSKGHTIVSMKPKYREGRDFSEAQLTQQEAFSEAILYAKAKKDEEIYKIMANGSEKSPFNIAVADWLYRPQFREIDLTGWKGGPEDVIRVKAYDDVKVVEVRVQLGSDDGVVLEEGLATEVGMLWWEYVPTGNLTGKLQVTITAKDLPGHVVEYSQVRTISAP